jgi:hypothetical protein
LLEESGVRVEGMRLDDLPDHIDQLFGYLSSFSSSTGGDDRRLVGTAELPPADQRVGTRRG